MMIGIGLSSAAAAAASVGIKRSDSSLSGSRSWGGRLRT